MLKEIISEPFIMEVTLAGKQSSKAEKLVDYLFKNKSKDGAPYLNYLYSIAHNFQDEMRYSVSLLQDILKETKITKNDLAVLGFREAYIEAIELLTKNKFESYEDYIEHLICSSNMVAIDIKLIIINHNINKEEKMTTICKEKQKLLNRYMFAKERLEKRKKELI